MSAIGADRLTPSRLLIGAVGLVVASYGGYLLVHDRTDQLVSVLVWLVGGVALHDFVLVPVVMLLLVVAGRLLPAAWRAPAAVVLVVLGTVSVVAVPFVGRFGELPDNPTLLDRDYTTGYLVLAGLVVGGVVAGTLVRRARARRDTPAATPPRDTPQD